MINIIKHYTTVAKNFSKVHSLLSFFHLYTWYIPKNSLNTRDKFHSAMSPTTYTAMHCPVRLLPQFMSSIFNLSIANSFIHSFSQFFNILSRPLLYTPLAVYSFHSCFFFFALLHHVISYTRHYLPSFLFSLLPSLLLSFVYPRPFIFFSRMLLSRDGLTNVSTFARKWAYLPAHALFLYRAVCMLAYSRTHRSRNSVPRPQ